MFQRISIIGLGLLGGSICRALKRQGKRVDITVFARSPEKLEKAKQDGAVDRILPMEAVSPREAELIIIAAPVIPSVDIMKSLLSHPELEYPTLIIDVGSVKRSVVKEAEEHNRGDRFIGCHPMTGSEKTGYEYSSEDLYRDAPVIITPHGNNDPADVDTVERFWHALGARTAITTAARHDAVVAATSHLPHLLACFLIQLASENIESPDNVRSFIGNGFRDMTRIAGGSPEMWADIFVENGDNIESVLSRLLAEILDYRKNSGKESAHEIFKNWLEDIRTRKDNLG